MRTLGYLFLFIFAVFVAGCSGTPVKRKPPVEAVEVMHQKAMVELEYGNYEDAASLFEALEAAYPYGRYAEQAQLNAAYSYYKLGESEAAVAAAERFVHLHPVHWAVDYAYYLKGLAYYQSVEGKHWDVMPARQAFATFESMIRRFPNSHYNQDAKKRMAKLIEVMGAHELEIARYYWKIGAYVAALERSQQVLREFQLSPAREEALAISARASAVLGLVNEARRNAKLLSHNYPNSVFLKQLEKDGLL